MRFIDCLMIGIKHFVDIISLGMLCLTSSLIIYEVMEMRSEISCVHGINRIKGYVIERWHEKSDSKISATVQNVQLQNPLIQ